MAEVVDERNFAMIVCNTSNDAKKERATLSMMEQQRVRGVIFAPASGYSDAAADKSIRLQLKNLKVPVVLVDREIKNAPWDGVFYENFQSGYLATEHLIQTGSREIGIITGDMDLKHARERYRGYAQAMEDYNLPVKDAYTYNGNYNVEVTYQVTKQMLQSGVYPEALVLSNNQTTLGFMKAMNESGLNQEGVQIRVVGIDHIPVLDMIGYQYNCVTRDMKSMGRGAIELLLARMEDEKKAREIRIVPCIKKFYD